jgi:hypothetical protein
MWGFACLSVLGAIDAYAQLTPPSVGAKFTLEAGEFRDNLAPDKVQQLEEDLTALLAELNGRYFKFLRWTPIPHSQNPDTVPTRLMVSLVATHHPLGARIDLAYRAFVSGQPLDLPHVSDMRMYEAWGDQPRHAPAVLLAQLTDSLKSHFQNQALRDHLQLEFLKHVPLTDSVHVDQAGERLVVPIAWEELRASDASVLLVKFRSKPPNRPEGGGHMKMAPDGLARVDNTEGLVRCAIVFFDFPPDRTTQWHPEIPLILKHVVGGLTIYMETYVLDTAPGTMGTLVIDPTDGGGPL